jgi:hypothetical protein
MNYHSGCDVFQGHRLCPLSLGLSLLLWSKIYSTFRSSSFLFAVASDRGHTCILSGMDTHLMYLRSGLVAFVRMPQ